MIKLLRVDDRLIHGQVAVVWTAFLQANQIIIANNFVANDPISKMALALAKPPGVALDFRDINSTIEVLKGTTLDDKKVFVVVESTDDALLLCEGLPEIDKVIFGGIRSSGEKKLIDRQVFLDENDFNNWKAMVALGKEVEIKVVPSEKGMSLSEAEHKFNKAK